MELLNDLCKFDRIVIEANISLSFFFFRYNVYCSVFKFEKKPTYLLPASCSALRSAFRFVQIDYLGTKEWRRGIRELSVTEKRIKEREKVRD